MDNRASKVICAARRTLAGVAIFLIGFTAAPLAHAQAPIEGVWATTATPRDCTSGYRCWRREALARLPLEHMVSDGYAFLVEMLNLRLHAKSKVKPVELRQAVK